MTDRSLEAFDDLRVVSGGHLSDDAVTVFVILRNEMYFLPAFLDHYRRIGAERFVILNDRSDDGSAEYLAEQDDVVLVESGYRYGDTLDLPEAVGAEIPNGRVLFVWRSLLHARFAMGRWAVQVDADEFLQMPPGRVLRDMFEELEEAPFDAVWGVMLDAYPADYESLMAWRGNERIDVGANWYFDGEPHLDLSAGEMPVALHPGARARLYHRYGVTRLYKQYKKPIRGSKLRRFWRHRVLNRPPIYNLVRKPVFCRWREGALYRSSHETTLASSGGHLVPFVHFRFAGSIYDKIEMALSENSYSSNSRDHRLMAALLEEMGQRNGSFRYRKSLPIGDYGNFVRSGNAVGFAERR